jgi:hypothetical protein
MRGQCAGRMGKAYSVLAREASSNGACRHTFVEVALAVCAASFGCSWAKHVIQDEPPSLAAGIHFHVGQRMTVLEGLPTLRTKSGRWTAQIQDGEQLRLRVPLTP